MTRCRLGKKKIEKYRKQLGLPIISGLVRGNTDHRIDFTLEDGRHICLYKDGEILPSIMNVINEQIRAQKEMLELETLMEGYEGCP